MEQGCPKHLALRPELLSACRLAFSTHGSGESEPTGALLLNSWKTWDHPDTECGLILGCLNWRDREWYQGTTSVVPDTAPRIVGFNRWQGLKPNADAPFTARLKSCPDTQPKPSFYKQPGH